MTYAVLQQPCAAGAHVPHQEQMPWRPRITRMRNASANWQKSARPKKRETKKALDRMTVRGKITHNMTVRFLRQCRHPTRPPADPRRHEKSRSPRGLRLSYFLAAALQRANVRRLQTLGALLHFELNPLVFLQAAKSAVVANFTEMREQIFAAVFRRDESETLAIVEPFDDASLCGAHENIPCKTIKPRPRHHAVDGQRHSRNVKPGVQTRAGRQTQCAFRRIRNKTLWKRPRACLWVKCSSKTRITCDKSFDMTHHTAKWMAGDCDCTQTPRLHTDAMTARRRHDRARPPARMHACSRGPARVTRVRR